VALTGCALEGGDASSADASSDEAEAVASAPQALTARFKIKSRRTELCLRASWSGTPVGGNLIGVKCGTEGDFYFRQDDQRRILTDTGHCVGVTNDGPGGALVIQDCSGDKDQKWTFRTQVERKIDAWHTKWIQFIESDNVGYFIRVPNIAPNTAAVSSTWSRSWWRDYDWAQDFQQ
jgi:hypothetical protein